MESRYARGTDGIYTRYQVGLSKDHGKNHVTAGKHTGDNFILICPSMVYRWVGFDNPTF